jgi:hypothetical protein
MDVKLIVNDKDLYIAVRKPVKVNDLAMLLLALPEMG